MADVMSLGVRSKYPEVSVRTLQHSIVIQSSVFAGEVALAFVSSPVLLLLLLLLLDPRSAHLLLLVERRHQPRHPRGSLLFGAQRVRQRPQQRDG